jgi:hypothetical protein
MRNRRRHHRRKPLPRRRVCANKIAMQTKNTLLTRSNADADAEEGDEEPPKKADKKKGDVSTCYSSF